MRYVAWRVLVWQSSLSLLVVTGGAGWAAPAPVPALTALTARRTTLIARIAELTDRSERDQAAVVVAQQRRSRTGARLADARHATRDRALKAYMHGLGQTAEALARPNVYLEVSFRRDRRAIEALRAARTADDGANRLADSARDASRAALVELGRVRRELEATIGLRERMDASAREATAAREAAARSRDAAAAHEAAGSRVAPPAGGHARATRSQQELMARYPVGPRNAIPAGLRPTGEVIAGTASWYGPGFDGRPTASGAIYDMEAWTCAHKTLPFGTLLLVSAHGRQVVVIVNDRGPYHEDWVLDLSHAAAVALDHRLGPVSAEVLVPA